MMKPELAWIWEWENLSVRLKVDKNVADIFLHFRQDLGGNERGGQLFVDINQSDGLWLSRATLPNKMDRSGTTWLSLDQNRCKEEIKIANKQGLRLVGYWHTHPELIPNLSPQDIKSFREFSQKNSKYLSCPLAVIVGNGTETNSIRAWSLQNNRFLLGLMKNRVGDF
ncbi:Mov34/MPN/PAD-1 family protein [Acinetobacter pittii]|uniref:Mov34/MPN/PAD-1 family protein n=1 Tax=Acinetobacter pittii TaxID=48296 RepID=UPI0038904907